MAAVAVLAHDNEYESEGLEYDNALFDMPGYTGDVPVYDYDGHAGHNSYVDVQNMYSYDGFYPNYIQGNTAYYGYPYGGHIVSTPEQGPEEESYIPGWEYGDAIFVTIDDDGNITLYPARDDYGAVLDGDYILLNLPGWHNPEDIRIELPDEWTYEINHESEPDNTVITFNHNWNSGQDDGFIGFMPLAFGAPSNFTILTPTAAGLQTFAGWNSLFAGWPGNLVITIPGTFFMPGAITIPAGRHIIITSAGTNLNNSVDNHTSGGNQFELRLATNARHFVVANGAVLTLSHIILDARNAANIPPNEFLLRGGIDVIGSGSRLYMRAGSVIRYCSAAVGGGVLARGQAAFTMHGGIIGGCVAAHTGGGVQIEGSTFLMQYSQVQWNRAASIAFNGGHGSNIGGGGIFIIGFGGVASMATLNSGSLITSNTAITGGGIRHYGPLAGTLFMNTGSTISSNTSTFDGFVGIAANAGGWGGGGIETTGGGTVWMNNGTIFGNVTHWSGGGINVSHGSTFVMIDGNISNNRTLAPSSDQFVAGNGGGISISETQIVRIYGGIISGNVSTRQGGGIHMYSSTLYLQPGVTGNGVTIYGNTASYAGGISVVGLGIPTRFVMNSGVVSNNGSTVPNNHPSPSPGYANIECRMGGGIIVRGSTAVGYMHNNAIVINNVAHRGGGVWLGGGSTFNMTNGDIMRNRAVNLGAPSAANDTGVGGGVFLQVAGTSFIMTGGRIHENIANTLAANRGGGGIEAINNSTVTLIQTRPYVQIEIFHNYAHNSGGGVNLFNNVTMTMHNTAIRRNGTNNPAAHGNGGGVAVNSSTFHFHSGNISDNVGRAGGGLFIYRSRVYMHPAASIRGNAGALFGGGVAVYSGIGVPSNSHLRMYGGTISHNGTQHHPIAHINPQGLPVPNAPGMGAVTSTPQGGGVATVRFFSSIETRGGVISHNTATFGGGAAVLLGSTMVVNPINSPVQINNNTATLDGGGVFISGVENRVLVPAIPHVASSFTMQSGGHGNELAHNTATRNGGGIFIGNDVVGSSRNNAILISSNIVGNTANAAGSRTVNGGGGGIYVMRNGRLDAAHSFITWNSAPNGMGGGIFTEWHDYNEPLTFVPPAFAGLNASYSNVAINQVTFNNNNAISLQWPPSNATAAMPAATFVSTSQPPIIVPPNRSPLNNFDINYVLEPVRFEFFKTDHQLYNTPPVINPIAGGQFMLFRTSLPSAQVTLSTGSVGLITIPPQPPWLVVPFANGELITTSIAGSPIAIDMDPRFTYQLVEIAAPAGYQIPMGQWRITHNIATSVFTVVNISDVNMPGAINSLDARLDGVGAPVAGRLNLWYIGNWLQLELPLTGGVGASTHIAAVGTVITIASLLILAIYLNKKDEVAKSLTQ